MADTVTELFTEICDEIRAMDGTTDAISHQSIASRMASNRSNYALKSEIPTALSSFENDSNYETVSGAGLQVYNSYRELQAQIPRKVSELTNDSGYAKTTDVEAQISKYMDTNLSAEVASQLESSETLQNAVDTYISSNDGGLATKADIEDIANALEYVSSKNIVDRSAFVDGYYSSGKWTESTTYTTSDWIEVNEGDTLYFYTYINANLALTTMSYWYEFDSDKKYVTRQDSGNSLVIPNGIKYIRVMMFKSAYDTRTQFMITKETVTKYEDYCLPYYKVSVTKDELVSALGYVPSVSDKSTVSKLSNVITISTPKAKYIFQRVTNTSINVDTWRLYSGYLLDTDKGAHLMWQSTDAEGAIKVSGEDDFVCGFHGDEIMETCRIFIDGKEVDLSQDFDNTEFDEMNVYVKSNVYHCNTSDVASTLLFTRNKHLKFYGNTVEVENYYTVKDAVTIESAKICLFQCYKTDSNDNQMLNTYSVNTDCDIYDVVLTGTTTKPASSKNMIKSQINTTYGSIDFESLESSAQNYSGYVVDFTDQNRIKWYFDTIVSNTSVAVGDIISSKFKWSIK